MQAVESISEVKKVAFDEVYSLSVTEFLNFLSYITWKNKQLEKKYKQQ
jgi:hypothetical protein